MRTLFIFIFLGIHSIGYTQVETDSTFEFTSIGDYFQDTTKFVIDYDEVIWDYTDTIEINLNKEIGYNKFKSGEEYFGTIKLNNSTIKSIKIKNITSPCTCLVTSVARNQVNPNEQFDLELKYKAMEPGDFEELITLYGYDGSLTRPLVLMNVKLVYSVELNDNN